MKIFIIGAPGSGKNVIAENLSATFGITHINYRSIINELIEANHKYSKELEELRVKFLPFPAKLALDSLLEYIQIKKIKDCVVDGFPKTTEEAELLVKNFSKKSKESLLTFCIDTDRDILVKRLKNRLVCPNCSFLIYDSNPESILQVQCTTCNLPLVRRQDDTDEGIKYRIDRYLENKNGLEKVLKKNSEFYTISGNQNLSEVINRAIEFIAEKENRIDTTTIGAARTLIEGLGLNLADPNIIGTPYRIVKTFKELMKGQNKDAQTTIKNHLATAFPTTYKGMVIMEPIKCISLCSHHLLPIKYELLFGYIPSKKSIGFSKIIKVIKLLGAKPTLQEDFTQEIIDVFEKILEPKGIMVVVRGVHECMSIRGEKSENINITSALRGIFKKEQKTREEFLSFAKFTHHE